MLKEAFELQSQRLILSCAMSLILADQLPITVVISNCAAMTSISISRRQHAAYVSGLCALIKSTKRESNQNSPKARRSPNIQISVNVQLLSVANVTFLIIALFCTIHHRRASCGDGKVRKLLLYRFAPN